MIKLNDILSIISGGTYIKIYVGSNNIFSGKMANVTKAKWDKCMSDYLDCEVIRLNTIDGVITIAV